MKRPLLVLLVSSLVPLSACERGTAAANIAPPARAAAKSGQPKPQAKVARIAFVDKERCCACTKARTDKSWKALTDVVGFPPVPDVERVHLDTQAAKAAPYVKLRAIMVPPAIYFLDAQGKLVEALQGEVTSAQVKRALGR